ncbi:Fe-Mn family superoxide dismutase [Candidatus Erwinia haradaeae]|uniref:Superoxide dismutase n=1 Tax=Candidatus Erwinia haradaeae TaxID=1922217 RepID=A0A451DGG8_9GAMM|nr:Fe-Mn family superoxide dismutase [Candidatus Erwinia haradaeae]VFP85723.1 Superoxide dismutase [Mn] [Candidatus Erwinia haradaeae]
MNYTLPHLPYAYNALEPYFDQNTMIIHHTKHHQTYINNANAALIDTEFSDMPVEDLISTLDQLPDNIRNILRNNAGGHANHSFFWKILKPNTYLKGNLKQAIENDFGNIDDFKETFEKSAASHFGSGWVWLVNKNNKLLVVSTANQDNPLMGELISGASGTPILGLDVWEHAYYLQYQNQRINYVKAFWNIVNWDQVSINFLKSV